MNRKETNNWELPVIHLERCTNCGACVDGCGESALSMGDSGPFFSAPKSCTYCTDCEALCAVGAIRCELEITWGD